MRETLVVCHECGTQSVLHVHEDDWPPKVFVCSGCSSFFLLSSVTKKGEPIFHAAGYCRFYS